MAGGWDQLSEAFHTVHRERFGFDRPGEAIELVNVRAISSGRPPITWEDLPTLGSGGEPVSEDGVWQRSTLPPGFVIVGPGVVIEENSATLLESGDRLVVLDDGTLQITVSGG
jgi:N-methylhydantoinase A/oxoprolinase/acetone carboxylase beta subunit